MTQKIKRKLQIFISSTFTDLKSERQAAVSAILKAGHIPAGMELFTAGDKSQLDVIRKWIDESDVYMLILGGRYGSIETISDLSYTEIEFDYAVLSSKPIFSVVINDEALGKKVAAQGADMLERVNPSKHEAFKSKVMKHLCAFFDDEKDIRLAVYEKMLEFSEEPHMRGWVPVDTIEDVAALRLEIAQLKKDKDRLEKVASQHTIRENLSEGGNHHNDNASENHYIKNILESKVYDLTSEKEEDNREMSVFETLMRLRDMLVVGFTLSPDPTGYSASVEKNAFPTLIVHGLLDTSPAKGGVFYKMTSKGLEFLAYLDRLSVDDDRELNIEPQ